MSNTKRTVYLVLMILAIVALLVLIVKDLRQGGAPPTSVTASLSQTVSPSQTASVPSLTPSPLPSPSTSPSAVPSPSATVMPSPAGGSVTTEQTADGLKVSVTVPGASVSYTITADTAVFTHTSDKDGELFVSAKDKNEFVRITYKPGVKALDTAPGFLNAYIDYTSFEQSGKNAISGTKISGVTVVADDGKKQVTAWLVDVPGGVLAVAAGCSLSARSAQTAQLDKLLATLTVK